jgi:pyrroline-5-carboxylate reductase
MEIHQRIGFIGAGNIAEAMIRGLLGHAAARAEQITASVPRTSRAVELRERWGIEVVHDNAEVVRRSDVVVLAVKPQMLLAVLEEIAGEADGSKLFLSVAAGAPLRAIESRLGSGVRVVRAMPNTAVLVQAGATAVAPGTGATEEDLALVQRIFDAVGVTAVVEEHQLDAVTGLSGSGPAYAMLVLEAMSDGGVRAGLSRRASQLFAAQTLLGAARLVLETGTHPAILREMVTSPGGTAITGLHVLEDRGVRAAIMSAIVAASERAKELGEGFERKSEGRRQKAEVNSRHPEGAPRAGD